MSRTSFIVMIAVGAGVLQGCSMNQPRATGTKTASAEHFKESAVVVETRNGGVDIAADPAASDVQITALITCGGATQADADQRLAAATISVSRDTTRTLTIKPVFPAASSKSPGSDGAKITIRLPDATGISVLTSNGSVAVKSLGGDLKIDSSNGAIKVDQHAGRAVIRTSNGAVSISGLGGAADVKTSNGAITCALGGDQVGPVKLISSNGSITAKFGGAFQGIITASTSNGKVKVDDAAGVVKSKSITSSAGTVTVGQGGEPSTITTSNGSVTIRFDK